MTEYPKDTIRGLFENNLPWYQIKSIISDYKDEARFETVVAILQEKVSWKEKILLPLTDKLYIVEKGEDRVVKCKCGYEFADWRQNWKLSALIHVRETEEELEELYPYLGKPDPRFCEIREYYCPGCASQLEVESVPFGYPAVFDFLPDLDTFYAQWLAKPLATEKEFKDLTGELTKQWGEEAAK